MSEPRDRRRRVAPEIGAVVLMLVVPFYAHLHFHRYPIWRPEALAVVAILALVGAAGGWILLRTHAIVVRALFTAIALLIGFDLLAPIDGWHTALFAAALALALVLRQHIHRIAALAFAAIGLSTAVAGTREPGVLDRAARSASGVDSLPPVLHLIADEHTGLDGIRPDAPGAADARRDLETYYLRHGFRLFPRAYSEYYLTADAIPNALNFQHATTGYGLVGGARFKTPAALTTNAYFARLVQRGYSLRIYEPGFIDYCAAEVAPNAGCVSLPSNSIYNLPALPMAMPVRAGVLLAQWVSHESSLLATSRRVYERALVPILTRTGVTPPRWIRGRYSLSPASGMATMHRIAADLRRPSPPRGAAFFGHVLLPHEPYVLNESCHVGPELLAPGATAALTDDATTADRTRSYANYLRQLRCFVRMVDTVVRAFDSQRDRGIVIIHGDHGSRVGDRSEEPVPPLTVSDFQAFYSTLFAIRGPGIPPGIDTSRISITRLLDEYSRSRFTGTVAPAPGPLFVYHPATRAQGGPLARIAIPNTGPPPQ